MLSPHSNSYCSNENACFFTHAPVTAPNPPSFFSLPDRYRFFALSAIIQEIIKEGAHCETFAIQTENYHLLRNCTPLCPNE
jgi:hypothetical protein